PLEVLRLAPVDAHDDDRTVGDAVVAAVDGDRGGGSHAIHRYYGAALTVKSVFGSRAERRRARRDRGGATADRAPAPVRDPEPEQPEERTRIPVGIGHAHLRQPEIVEHRADGGDVHQTQAAR